MGGSVSKPHVSSSLKNNESSIVKLMMPVYYCVDPLTDEEFEAAKACWTAIANNTAPGFVAERRQTESFSHSTCISFFNECFFWRLFDSHPLSKDLFKDTNQQGKFLVKLISLALSERSDPDKYERTLVTLTEIHNERGIKAVEYGLVGDVILWSISRCMGKLGYLELAHRAWVKILSRMLRTMVPLAVAYELKDGTSQSKRVMNTLSIHSSTSSDDFADSVPPNN